MFNLEVVEVAGRRQPDSSDQPLVVILRLHSVVKYLFGTPLCQFSDFRVFSSDTEDSVQTIRLK